MRTKLRINTKETCLITRQWNHPIITSKTSDREFRWLHRKNNTLTLSLKSFSCNSILLETFVYYVRDWYHNVECMVWLCCAVPVWGVIVVGVTALVIVLICCGCLCKMCWKRRKDKNFKKGLKGAVQMLGSTLKDKVSSLKTSLGQHETKQLTTNMADHAAPCCVVD